MEKDKSKDFIQGRGAQMNTENRFSSRSYISIPELEDEFPDSDQKTRIHKVTARTIVNEVPSEDLPFRYSMNPYQGCEHGCVYCYARNTHNYWGYSAGLEFEQNILVKHNAAELLHKQLSSKKWEPSPIVMSGNTDCYQPVEKKLEITRSLLKVFLRHRHPVSIITKNALILRDLDLLTQLNKDHLVHVAISINCLDEEIRNLLEPRTSTIRNRLRTVEILSDNGIPVTVMIAPVIPGLTDYDILNVAKKAAESGASNIFYQIVRLNGDVSGVFEDWVKKALPGKADKILNRIADCHNGKLNDSRTGKRLKGEGNIAEVIRKQFELGKKLYFKDKKLPPLNTQLYKELKDPQLKLF